MTTVNYDPNVPQQVSDALATSQPEFLNNFQALYDIFSVNHVALDAGSLAGNHTIIELPAQPKGLQTDAGEISVYSKTVEGSTEQVFIRYQGNGQEVQYTAYQLYSLPQTSSQTQFFSFLPGKILVYFGIINAPGANFTLNLSPPIARKIMSMSFCAIGNTPQLNPSADILQDTDGFIKQIQVNTPIFNRNLVPLYYLVLANI